MTHPFLSIAEHEKAFHILCDSPNGSTRSWAAQLGWSPSKVERFLKNLKTHGLAEIERIGNYGSVFRPVSARTGPSRPVSAVSDRSTKERLTASDTKERAAKHTPAEIEAARPYIEIANEILAKFSDFKPIKFDSPASIAAALKMIALAGGDRGLEYFRLALHEYQPHKSGGDAPFSLAHPYFLKRVRRRAATYDRELASGQLSITFVEKSEPRPVYGKRRRAPDSGPHIDAPRSQPTPVGESFAEIMDNLRREQGRI